MKTQEATVHVYDYSKKKKKNNLGNLYIIKVFKVYLPLLIFIILVYCFYKYSNKDKIIEIDKKIALSIEQLQIRVKRENFKEDYLLVTFPDNSKILSDNGYLINDIGILYEEFSDGYIIMYRNGKYKFELQDSGYCATKDSNDKVYQLLIFKKCSSKKVDYLKR